MLYVFKTHGWFNVPFKPANDRLRRQLGRQLLVDEVITKPAYMEGCVSVLSLTLTGPIIMFHYAKKESIFYTEDQLAYMELILNKYGIKYAIYNAKTNECVKPYPAIIAVEQAETVGEMILSQ